MRYHHGWHDGGTAYPWLHFVLFVLVIAAIVFLVMMLLRRWPDSADHLHHHPPERGRGDQALAELRLRYARGDIDREDYLRRAADLGDTSALLPPPPPPAAPPPPPPTDT